MSKRVLAIGVGGTGKAALNILKERIEETYGQVPDNVVLLSLDTDDLRPEDSFGGTRLSPQYDERRREPEFRHVVSKPGVTMDTIFADIAHKRTSSFMHWLEKDKLDRVLGPTERDIRGGAQQRRPVGRVAVFQRWDNPITSSILDAINRVYGEPEDTNQSIDNVKIEQSKRLVFIIGSVAGGTGSGFIIDIANIVRNIVVSNSRFQSVDVSAIVVLPDAFSAYTTVMNDPTNLKPNSYAGLREMDRFIRTHSASLPFMVRYGDDLRSVTWSTNQLLDHVYLVDTASPSAIGDFDLRGDPMRGVFPVIADFVMAHVDSSLGDSLATLRSNSGQHYSKEDGWQYSSFNVMTYILPLEDIIKSFSFRFLRDMLARQFLIIQDKRLNAEIEQKAADEAERIFSENSIQDKVNPAIVQKAIACNRRITPETPDISWRGLFNMISLSESAFATDYKELEDSLQHLQSNLIPTKEGDYKRETYAEGNVRLANITEQFMDDCLGSRIDPDNEDERLGGDWDNTLGRYRPALRTRFAEALDVALLTALNRRDPQSKYLEAARLVHSKALVATLRKNLVAFRNLLEKEYRQVNLDVRLRQTNESLRNAITWMHETQETKIFSLLGQPDARKAQDSYIGLFIQKMELMLHQRIYETTRDILDTLGADEKDLDNNLSVLDQASLELETWQDVFEKVDTLLVDHARSHENSRSQKQRVKVRRYLTNKEFEDKLYQKPEHFGFVASRVLSQVRGENGINWKRAEGGKPLDFKMVTLWTQEAKGPDEIAQKFLAGVRELFQVVRNNVTIADRIQAEFSSSASFVNVARQVNEPFLRYNPASNEKPMAHEFYVAFNLTKAQDDARRFLEEADATLRQQGVNVVGTAESKVACTVLEVARGVRLRAVDQFIACEADYRTKLYKGRESLHLFTEEQVASQYEGQIEALNESDNRLRPLAPELVISMGDRNALRLFTLACVYNLIGPDTFVDDKEIQSREVFLTIQKEGALKKRLLLSDSAVVRIQDPHFNSVEAKEQLARLYFNALQNFVLKVMEKPEIPSAMVANLVDALRNRGVSLGKIENPFTLPLRDLGYSIRQAVQNFGPTEAEESDKGHRDAENYRRRKEKIEKFINETVRSFKKSPAQVIVDMGTVMHLVLREELKDLD